MAGTSSRYIDEKQNDDSDEVYKTTWFGFEFSGKLSQRRSQGGGWMGSSPPPLSDQNIDVHFLSFSPTLYCKSRSGALQNVLWQYHRRSNTFVIKPSGYEFSRFEKYWSSFVHSCVFCATIYNKSWVLPGGLDILKFDKNSTDLKCFIFQFWGAWSFVWGAKLTKYPHGDRIVLVMEAFSLY